MMLDAAVAAASSSSLMMVGQHFFQQQQQQAPPWDYCDYGYEYEEDGSKQFCLSSSSCSWQEQQHKLGGAGTAVAADCSSSSSSKFIAGKEKDPLEEILDAGYFDTLSPPKTPPQRDDDYGFFVHHDMDDSNAAASACALIHQTPPMDDVDWMDSFMSQLDAAAELEVQAPLVNPAAAVCCDQQQQQQLQQEESPESSADALLSCYPPCTPDDIWREHFGLNLQQQQQPQASCSSDEQQQQHNAGEEDGAVVQLLVAALDDIEGKRTSGAASNLALLKSLANPSGDPMQRVAAHFGEALQLRLNRMLHPEAEAEEERHEEAEVVAAYKMLDEACPYLKFAHLTANQALLDATEGASKVHIVDFGTVRGVQWAALLQAFSGTSRSLRITGIPSPELGGEPAAAMMATGRRLTDFARLLKVDFQFCPVLQPIDRLDESAIGRGDPGEAVGVNFLLQLAALPAAALRRALAVVHRLNPRIVTVAEFETNNGASARERLASNVGFYAAVFSSIDASAICAQSELRQRLRAAEEMFLGRDIRASLLMEEGGEFSPERREQWQRCIDEAGLWSASLSHYATSQARLLLWLYGGGGDGGGGGAAAAANFTLSQGPGGCISLGWRGRSIITVSAWHC